MTCREKLMAEKPELIDPTFIGGCDNCPSTYGYLDDPEFCDYFAIDFEERCVKCWDREIPENEHLRTKSHNKGYELIEAVRCCNCLYSVEGKDKSYVICTVEKMLRDSDFFCRNGEPKKN